MLCFLFYGDFYDRYKAARQTIFIHYYWTIFSHTKILSNRDFQNHFQKREEKLVRTHEIRERECNCDVIYNGEKTFEVVPNFLSEYQKGDHVKFIPVTGFENDSTVCSHPIDSREYIITYVYSGYGVQPGCVIIGFVDSEFRIEDRTTERLKLSLRAYNTLARNGIRTIKALEGLTHYELMRLRGMGSKTAEEIEQKMKEYKNDPDWHFER